MRKCVYNEANVCPPARIPVNDLASTYIHPSFSARPRFAGLSMCAAFKRKQLVRTAHVEIVSLFFLRFPHGRLSIKVKGLPLQSAIAKEQAYHFAPSTSNDEMPWNESI